MSFSTIKPRYLSINIPSFGFVIFVLLVNLASPKLFAMDYPDAEQIKSISANWECQWCPYKYKGESSGTASIGAGYVSNDSYKHGDYTGLDNKGLYGIAAADYIDRSSAGVTLHVQAKDLGLDSRSARLSGGNPGIWYGSLDYKQIPKLNSDTSRTPYSGNSQFSLPAGWTTGDSTQKMLQLDSALHNKNIYTQRDIVSLHGTYYQSQSLSYQFAFERNHKEGTRTAGLALGSSFASATSAILPIPVDYLTNQGEVKINFQQSNWQTALAYQFSNFASGNHSVRWQNAYTNSPPAPSQGQASLEPDNTMQKLVFQGSYQFSPSTHGSAQIAVGRMQQDDRFLPYTINSSLALPPPPLPADSLNGMINTIDATINLNSHINTQFQVTAKFQQNEQNNDTDRHTYTYVTADNTTQSATPRANFPYSFRQQQAKILGQYQVAQHEFSLGVQRTAIDRTYQEVETTTENAVNGAIASDLVNNISVKIRGERSQRKGDNYQVKTEIQPPENPLLRKYNMADRNRDQLGISVTYSPDQLDIGVYLEASKNDYNKSELGLLESSQKDYSIALGYRFTPALDMNLDYTITTIESKQAGSQTYSIATWQAKNDDHIDAIHLAIHYQWIPKLVKLGIEYEYAKSAGDTKVSTDAPFPVLRTERQTVLLSGDYQLNDKSTVTAFYRFEHYDEKDWANDNVNVNTIPNVLSLGDISPSYNIGVIGAALKFHF